MAMALRLLDIVYYPIVVTSRLLLCLGFLLIDLLFNVSATVEIGQTYIFRKPGAWLS